MKRLNLQQCKTDTNEKKNLYSSILPKDIEIIILNLPTKKISEPGNFINELFKWKIIPMLHKFFQRAHFPAYP